MLLDLYRNDPDSGIHGATLWALRQWKQLKKLKAIDAEPRPLEDRGARRWYVNSQGKRSPSSTARRSSRSDRPRPIPSESPSVSPCVA